MYIIFILGYLLLLLPLGIVAYLLRLSRHISKVKGTNDLVVVISRYLMILLILYIAYSLNLVLSLLIGEVASVIYGDIFFRFSLYFDRFLIYPLGIVSTLYLIYGIISSQEVVEND